MLKLIQIYIHINKHIFQKLISRIFKLNMTFDKKMVLCYNKGCGKNFDLDNNLPGKPKVYNKSSLNLKLNL